MREPRATLIREILDRTVMHDLGLAAATPEPTQWRDMDDVIGPNGPFGLAWPIDHGDEDPDHPVLIGYCPEIIDEQTAHLSDEELQQYLDVLIFVITKSVANWTPDADRLTLVQRAENELYEAVPGAMDLVNSVQLRAVEARRASK